jgi:hypothetical protein
MAKQVKLHQKYDFEVILTDAERATFDRKYPKNKIYLVQSIYDGAAIYRIPGWTITDFQIFCSACAYDAAHKLIENI